MARRSRSLRSTLLSAAALVALVVGGAVLQDDGVPAPAAREGTAPVRQDAGLPAVRPAELPREARQVLALIDRGGPFPYPQDGSVFANREGLLPPERRGCYREYTVRTPGERDRGARRVVTSCAGPRYWTADHYESFARIAA